MLIFLRRCLHACCFYAMNMLFEPHEVTERVLFFTGEGVCLPSKRLYFTPHAGSELLHTLLIIAIRQRDMMRVKRAGARASTQDGASRWYAFVSGDAYFTAS